MSGVECLAAAPVRSSEPDLAERQIIAELRHLEISDIQVTLTENVRFFAWSSRSAANVLNCYPTSPSAGLMRRPLDRLHRLFRYRLTLLLVL
jgi:hypothetical protein